MEYLNIAVLYNLFRPEDSFTISKSSLKISESYLKIHVILFVMKYKYYWMIGLVAILSLVGLLINAHTQTIGNSTIPKSFNDQRNICEDLTLNFDAKIDSLDYDGCNRWSREGKKPIWVGARLINITRIYNEAYERYEFKLTFKGYKKQGDIYIGTKNESIPYEVGKFYKFDLSRECWLIYSMASSGMFSDPELNALEHLKECD